MDTINLKENTLTERLTALSNIVNSYDLRLKGWKSEKDGKFVYTGKVMAGSETIERVILLLSPFSENINLLTDKEKTGTWVEQRYNTIKSFLIIITNAIDVTADNYRPLSESFWNVLINIGDIILGSKELIGKSAFAVEEPRDPVDV